MPGYLWPINSGSQREQGTFSFDGHCMCGIGPGRVAVSPAQGAGQAGQLDASFGRGGIVKTALTGTDMSTGGKSIVQADGKTLATGEQWFGPQFVPALVRYNVDGSLDQSFGFGGTASISLGKQAASVAGTVQTPDGGYLVVATNMREHRKRLRIVSSPLG